MGENDMSRDSKQQKTSKRHKSKKIDVDIGNKFKIGEWVYDKTDGFHGLVTAVDTDDGVVYTIRTLAAHDVVSDVREVAEDLVAPHKPIEFRETK